MRLRRVMVRGLVGVVALVVVLLALAAVVSQTATFRDWLRRQVVTRVNAGLNGEVTIGRLEGNLVQGLVVTDVRLRSEGRRVLAVRRVSAGYDLVRLLTGGGLVLRDVELSGLALDLVEDERGWNVARLSPPTPEPQQPSTLEVVLDRARLADASVKVVRRADVWRVRDLRVDGSARFGPSGQALTLAALSATLPGRDVRVAELTGKIVVAADGALRADGVHLRTDASELHADARVPGKSGGAYDVSLDVPHLAAAEVRRLVRGTLPATDLGLRAHVRGPAEWASVDAALTSDAGEIALDGNAGLGPPPSYDLRTRLTALNVAGLLGPARPTTNLNGTVTLKGKGATLEDAAASAAVALENSTISDRTISRLSVDGDVAERQVTFTAATALGGGEAEAHGTVGLADERYDLHVTTRALDPAPLVGRPDLHAQLSATATLAGTGFRPDTARAEAHLAMTRSTIEQVEVASAKADLRATNGTLAIDALRVDASAVQLEASGTVAVGSQPTAATGALQYRVRASDLAPVGRIVGAGPLAGSLAVEGTANGGLGNLGVRATIDGRQLAVGGAVVGTLAGHVAGDGIGGARARADVDAHANDVHAAGRHFATLDASGHWEQQTATRSMATATLHAQEDARHLHEVVLSAALDPSERRVTISSLRLDLGDDTWRAEGTPVVTQRGTRVAIDRLALRSTRGLVRIDGEAGTTGAQNLDLRLEGFDLATFEKNLQTKVSGSLSATAHLGGSAAAPDVQAHVTIAAPTVEQVRYESAAVEATIGGGRAAVTARVVQAGPRQLALDASSPVRLSLSPFTYAASGALAGTLRADAIDLTFLGPFLPQVSKLAGVLNADLALGGSVAAPEARGPLAITGGRAYVVPAGLTYDPVEVRLTLEGTAVSIDTLSITSRKGTLRGGGNARMGSEGAAMDARFELDRFPLFANEYGEGVVSGWVWLAGTTAAPVVEGSLTTNRFVLLVPEQLPGSVRPPDPTITVVAAGAAKPQPIAATEPAGPPAPPVPPAPKPGVYDRAAITVQIDIPRDAWIRRSDTDVELRGWMTAWKKPEQELALAGVIDTVRGWYTFQGKTFTVEEGRVSFTGQDFNPVLELTARYTAGDYTVRIKIGGTLAKPTLTLESEPALEQADILSVLLFGKPANELSKGESAGLREQAIGVASSYVAKGLTQSVGRALGVDVLQFQTGGQGVQGASVSVGKYVAPNVFVTLAHRFAKQGVQEVRVEYSFRPHWSVESSSDTVGETGVDVFWKRRY